MPGMWNGQPIQFDVNGVYWLESGIQLSDADAQAAYLFYAEDLKFYFKLLNWKVA